MSKTKSNKLVLVGIITMAAVFLFFCFGIKIFLKINITGPNIKAYIITAIITGLFSVLFFSFRQKISFVVYLLSLVTGFTVMYIMFINGSEQWDDIIGVMYFFVCTLAGFILGLLIQLIVKLVNRKKPIEW